MLTTNIGPVEPIPADLINLTLVVNPTSAALLLAGDLVRGRRFDIDVLAKFVVEREEPGADLVGLNPIAVEVLLGEDVRDGGQLHANDLGQVKVLLGPACYWIKVSELTA